MDILHKVIDCEVKKLNDLTFEFTASTEDIDRDGEVIEAKGWDLKNFKKNPVITYAHDYHALPIGKAPKVWVSDGKLKNHVEFPADGVYPFADVVRRLVEGGFLKAESVGFKPYPDSIVEVEGGDGVKTPRRRLTKNELLEISIVPVPSNPNALMEARAKGVITDKELALITKPEETENFIRIPVNECPITATIDISKKEGISALYCGKEKEIATYLFDKRDPYNWTMERAKAWIKEHGKEAEMADTKIETPVVKVVSQEGIIDEIDYLKQLIAQVGLNTEGLKSLKELLERIPGSDKPVEIEKKEEPIPPPPIKSGLDVKEVAAIVARTIAQMKGKII